MNKLILGFLVIFFSCEAMENIILISCDNDDPVTQNRKVASLIDAYLNAQIEIISSEECRFADYDNEDLKHQYPVETINKIISRIPQVLTDDFFIQNEKAIQKAFDILNLSPLCFGEKHAKIVQMTRLNDFLKRNDLSQTLDENEKKLLENNRNLYRAAWLTQDIEAIKNAMKTLRLYSHYQPTLSLAEHFKKKN